MNEQLLLNLCSTVAPSGSEKPVSDIIIKEIQQYTDNISVDRLGNVIAKKKGPGKKLMFSASIDQPGAIISFIDSNGFLRFASIGAFIPKTAPGQKVMFENGLVGLIGAEPFVDEKIMTINNLFIDIGAISYEEAVSLVSIGDICIFSGMTCVDDKKIITPAINRVGAFALVQAIKEIKSSEYDLYFVFTIQKEIESRGAQVTTYAIEPHFAINIDIIPTFDIPSQYPFKTPVTLGKGGAVKIKDRSGIASPKMIKYINEAASEGNIPVQADISEEYISNIGAIYVSKTGVNTGGISIPARYANCFGGLCLLKDIESVKKLIVKCAHTILL